MKKLVKDGLVVIQDTDYKYADVFADMLTENYRRHASRAPGRVEIATRLDEFRQRSRLFVALLDGKPIASLLCHYTPSTCYLAKAGSYEKDTDNANRLCWKAAIEDACNSGCKYVECGVTSTPGLAFFKDRFKGARVPMRVYEKSYSLRLTIVQKVPVLVSNVWHDKGYIWNSRRLIWDRIVRR